MAKSRKKKPGLAPKSKKSQSAPKVSNLASKVFKCGFACSIPGRTSDGARSCCPRHIHQYCPY